ncbi:uncharacterized protein LOC123273266 [Cotesia glomerata]|uniref:uncharacterized protein LOC123273266 n=1 Tax=Cotesia glomerata TaxID=32391 RepID=UPI001D0339BF|nr:uncharacterized protein LOC123273266 [Cotesia glomerata]XP_044596582.1 uncharacterized protein LOC123273266 [Cotesia glomerata]XP_044596583.1 uncharacterized protein LOC123273266 [Cotesia glomerata]XP_044596584.1 uncharacterized protein LOC123273266 [Cotesia glomerata]
MRLSHMIASIMMGVTWTQAVKGNQYSLFDFTTASNVDNWSEISDTVRTPGMSKAVLTLQKTQLFQRGIFFTLLNPQPNGAGFAGVRMPTTWDLSGYTNIEIKCRAQGNNEHYKVVLRHKGLASNDDTSYEQTFEVPVTNKEFSTISLPLKNFKPYYRGQEVLNGTPLDTANITTFGLQVFGGVYSPFKQHGVSALEIETIVATI